MTELGLITNNLQRELLVVAVDWTVSAVVDIAGAVVVGNDVDVLLSVEYTAKTNVNRHFVELVLVRHGSFLSIRISHIFLIYLFYYLCKKTIVSNTLALYKCRKPPGVVLHSSRELGELSQWL